MIGSWIRNLTRLRPQEHAFFQTCISFNSSIIQMILVHVLSVFSTLELPGCITFAPHFLLPALVVNLQKKQFCTPIQHGQHLSLGQPLPLSPFCLLCCLPLPVKHLPSPCVVSAISWNWVRSSTGLGIPMACTKQKDWAPGQVHNIAQHF